MDFLMFYPKGKNLYVEIIPDKLIDWQPKIEGEIPSKIKDVSPVIEKVKDVCDVKGFNQIIIIDCDKAVQFDKLNYVLICKFIQELTNKYPDRKNTLKRIEVRHCNSAITGIYNASKPLLPKKIADIFHLYSN